MEEGEGVPLGEAVQNKLEDISELLVKILERPSDFYTFRFLFS